MVRDGIGPGTILNPKVVQATAGFHHLIADMFPPESEFVFDDPTTFHAAHHMLNPYADAGQPPVLRFLIGRQGATAWLFRRLRDRNPGDGKALKAQVLIQDRVRGEAIVFLVGHRFIVPRSFIGRAEKVNAAVVGNQQQIFERMLFFLAAVVDPLLVGVGWPIDWTFRAIMQKKMGRQAQHARQLAG